MSFKRKGKKYSLARAQGFRSGLEVENNNHLTNKGEAFSYEEHKIGWVDFKARTYTPDFILANGIIIETKGYFKPEDRTKHLLIKEQYPELDIRFVFTRAKTPIRKGSKTTYAMWCEKNGFKWAETLIPDSWINEPELGFSVIDYLTDTLKHSKKAIVTIPKEK